MRISSARPRRVFAAGERVEWRLADEVVPRSRHGRGHRQEGCGIRLLIRASQRRSKASGYSQLERELAAGSELTIAISALSSIAIAHWLLSRARAADKAASACADLPARRFLLAAGSGART